jgi:hypothetical protein
MDVDVPDLDRLLVSPLETFEGVQAILVLIPQPMHLLGVELCVINLVG